MNAATARAAKIKVTKVVERIPDRKFAEYVVTADGVEIGMLRKWRDTRSNTFPWAALAGRPADPYTPRRLIGSFFKADGYKAAALAAVVANGGAA